MKIIKIIIALLIAYSAFSSLAKLSSTEYGAGFAGVVIGFLIFMSISIYLFYSALKSDDKNKKDSDKSV